MRRSRCSTSTTQPAGRRAGTRDAVSALSSITRPLATGPTARQLDAGTRSKDRGGRESPGRRRGLPRVGRRLATMALLVALGIALLAAVPSLRGVLREIGDIGPGWILAAVALEFASAVSFVVVFRLFFDALDARDARILAWTAQGSGALLPGGGAGGWRSAAGWPRLRVRRVGGSCADRPACSSSARPSRARRCLRRDWHLWPVPTTP